jgi:hypothetical protein
MKSKTFTGKDKPDLDRQIWSWRSANLHISVKKIHPIKDVPFRMHRPHVRFDKIKSEDRVSVRVDYEGSN